MIVLQSTVRVSISQFNAAQLIPRLSVSWIDGQRLFYDIGSANSSHAVTGTPPLRVVLGNAPGVSVSINQPGVYGRVDIGNVAPPPLVYAQPVVIAPPRVVVPRQPIYLYVPPGHQQNWRTYCGALA